MDRKEQGFSEFSQKTEMFGLMRFIKKKIKSVTRLLSSYDKSSITIQVSVSASEKGGHPLWLSISGTGYWNQNKVREGEM